MARNIIGATAAELKEVRNQAYAMLKDNGPAPEGRFAELKFLEPVRDYKARHASTLLTFDAVVDCVEEIEAKAKAARRDKHATAKKPALHALSSAGIKFRVR